MTERAKAIHNSGCQLVLAVTGGGASAIAELLATPGASRSILEAIVPYSAEALVQFLGGKPDQACAPATARAMAMASYVRGQALVSAATQTEPRTLIGVGCTASLASDRPKRGDHRVHVALQTSSQTITATLELEKDRRSRAEEESLASSLLLELLLAHATGGDFAWRDSNDNLQVRSDQFDAPMPWSDLLAGARAWSSAHSEAPPGSSSDTQLDLHGQRVGVYSGAFRPRHEGHRKIAEIGQSKLGRVIHEISILNVDKPPLDFVEMSERASQFSDAEELIFTRCPTFSEKAIIFPGCTFLVGVDTVLRISDPKYYGGEKNRDEAIALLGKQDVRFLVFGRNIGGVFQTFDPSSVVPSLAELCDGVSEQDFRADISSTTIRNGQS